MICFLLNVIARRSITTTTQSDPVIPSVGTSVPESRDLKDPSTRPYKLAQDDWIASPGIRRGRNDNCYHKAFTLIELAIAVVIIGLVVGGVLVGRDLIKSAEVTKGVSQIEEYKAAVNLFRNKYGGLPGDLHATIASKNGFSVTNRTGIRGRGDGNKIIEGTLYGGNPAVGYCGEVQLFFRDLAEAGYIDGDFQGEGGVYYDCQGGSNITSDFDKHAPIFATGDNHYVFVWSDGEYNYYQVFSGFDMIDDSYGMLRYGTKDIFSPMEAKAMDDKMDDGLPLTGTVRARNWSLHSPLLQNDIPVNDTPAAPATGVCVSNESGNPYNGSVDAEAPACSISFRM